MSGFSKHLVLTIVMGEKCVFEQLISNMDNQTLSWSVSCFGQDSSTKVQIVQIDGGGVADLNSLFGLNH